MDIPSQRCVCFDVYACIRRIIQGGVRQTVCIYTCLQDTVQSTEGRLQVYGVRAAAIISDFINKILASVCSLFLFPNHIILCSFLTQLLLERPGYESTCPLLRRTDCEQICSGINNNVCRMFRPHRPLSTAYKTILYTVDKGLHGQNILQSLLFLLLRICSRSVSPILTKQQ